MFVYFVSEDGADSFGMVYGGGGGNGGWVHRLNTCVKIRSNGK